MTGTTYPADAGPDLYLLTVLGTPTTGSGAASRDLHNATAGDPGGVAAAKSFGDLSHNVFLPADADDKRLLFLDNWNSPQGLGTFFADEQVLAGRRARSGPTAKRCSGCRGRASEATGCRSRRVARSRRSV